jgi:Protein of unknown function (DUF3828)
MSLAILLALASTAAESPRAFVERVYAGYRSDDYNPLNHSERLFAARLNAAIKEDERLAHGEVGFLDGDPLCNCQDTSGMHSHVLSINRAGSRATAHVLVTWQGSSDRRDVRLDLVQTGKGWRIADVGTSEELSLLKDLEAANRKARKH